MFQSQLPPSSPAVAASPPAPSPSLPAAAAALHTRSIDRSLKLSISRHKLPTNADVADAEKSQIN